MAANHARGIYRVIALDKGCTALRAATPNFCASEELFVGKVFEAQKVRFAQESCEAAEVTILGVTIANLGFDQAITQLRAAMLGAHQRTTLFFANAHTLRCARRDPAFRDCLNAAELVLADGTGVRWAADMQGVRLRANLNGTDLLPALLAAGNADGLRLYLVGSTPAGIERTAKAVARLYPGWQIAGTHHGFLDAETSEAVVADIARSGAHLLLVAMGNPLQEFWLMRNRDRLPVPLAAGVGGLFHYLSGDYRRAPAVLRRLGLEWCFVLLLQRWKWRRYLLGGPLFILAVLAERWRTARS